MSRSYIGQYIVYDARGSRESSNEIVNIDSKFCVYEVLRVMLGKPLFLKDHLIRLSQSLNGLGITEQVISDEEVIRGIDKLCFLHENYNGNIEIKIVQETRETFITFIGFIPHSYPKPLDYLHGVKTNLLSAERDHPNVKQKGSKARDLSDSALANCDVYEVLLVNSKGFITEGSRSNVFFIIKDKIFTSPSNYVLKGITRNYTLNIINSRNISIDFTPISVEDISSIDAAFLCGTSPGILPISSLSGVQFNVKNAYLKTIMQDYNSIIQQYLKLE